MPSPWAFHQLRQASRDPMWHPGVGLRPEIVQQADVPVCTMLVVKLLDQAREDGVRAGLACACNLLTVPDDIPREKNIIASDRDLTVRVLQSCDPARILANYDRKT